MATAAWSASRPSSRSSEALNPPRVRAGQVHDSNDVVVELEGYSNNGAQPFAGQVCVEGMLLHVLDDDLLAVAGHGVCKAMQARQRQWGVAMPIIIQGRAELELAIIVKENMGRARILDQAHGFCDHGIQHGLKIEAGSQVQAELLQRIQLIGLLFQREDQVPILDQRLCERASLLFCFLRTEVSFDGLDQYVQKFQQLVALCGG